MAQKPTEGQDDAALVWLQSAVAELLEAQPIEEEAGTGAVDVDLAALLEPGGESSTR